MNLQATAVSLLRDATKMLVMDLEALPEEASIQRFSPATRTVADIIYEVKLVNDHIGMVIRGEEPFTWPEGDWIKAPADFQTKQAVIEGFKQSADTIVATAQALSAEDLETTVKTEHGDTSRFERCQFMALHMWYHSGQLNFIQTLRGDDKWHWN